MNPTTILCWSCRGMVPTGEGFCPGCRIIQPPDPRQDHFASFALKPDFTLDLAALDQGYREQQQRFHPDLFATRGATERRYSMEHVTRLNEGYRILKDPLLRGEYLLKIAGFRSQTPENSAPSDPAFLMEVMELRESLEEVDLKRGDALDHLTRLRHQVEEACSGELQALTTHFAAWFDSRGQGSLVQAARHIDRLRYFIRFIEELDRKEERSFL
ncbi:MAG: Fe-S protein assembly co-chaperone HscB [Magnetococcales bacterium]|nr:Fe-S protein assembly co-chaperone HscB [Magnetococcales bacterium]